MAATPFQRFRNATIRLMARMMPSCREITQLVSASMDERLPLRKRLSIRFHVLMCNLCRRYEKQLHLLRGGTRHYASPEENDIEDSLSPEARQRLQRKLTSNH